MITIPPIFPQYRRLFACHEWGGGLQFNSLKSVFYYVVFPCSFSTQGIRVCSILYGFIGGPSYMRQGQRTFKNPPFPFYKIASQPCSDLNRRQVMVTTLWVVWSATYFWEIPDTAISRKPCCPLVKSSSRWLPIQLVWKMLGKSRRTWPLCLVIVIQFLGLICLVSKRRLFMVNDIVNRVLR